MTYRFYPVQADREKQRRIMTAEEEHARKLEMQYKEAQCEADRAQAKKEVLAFRHPLLRLCSRLLCC